MRVEENVMKTCMCCSVLWVRFLVGFCFVFCFRCTFRGRVSSVRCLCVLFFVCMVYFVSVFLTVLFRVSICLCVLLFFLFAPKISS